MEHLEVVKNTLKRVRALRIELEFGKVGFWRERGKPEHPEKNLSARKRTNNKPTLSYT